MKTKILLALVLIAVVITAGCIYGGGTSATSGEQKQQTGISTDTGTGIIIEGSDFKFTPDTISVLAKEKTKITFKNAGSAPHNLVISVLGVQTKTISPGQSETIEIYSDNSGEYTFYCGVGNHKALGMEGKIQVLPKATAE